VEIGVERWGMDRETYFLLFVRLHLYRSRGNTYLWSLLSKVTLRAGLMVWLKW
jgi:hypothetical protein